MSMQEGSFQLRMSAVVLSSDVGLSSGGRGQKVSAVVKSVNVVCNCNVLRPERGVRRRPGRSPSRLAIVRRAPFAVRVLQKLCVPLGASGFERHDGIA